MNILIDPLPDSVEIDGKEYRIRTDFRYWVMFELLMQDRLITDQERVITSLNLCYEDEIPEDAEAAIEKILWFYAGGKEGKKGISAEEQQEPKRIYCFDQDDEYIYSAFLSQYGIDLQDEELHWWKFKAMFKSLKEDNLIVKIMGYRSIVIDSKMTPEQQRFYSEMKALYALDDGRTEEEKQAAFECDLLSGL